MTSSAELEAAASSISHDQVLLVEDDDGDALLVEELLLEVDAPVVVRRAHSLNQAKTMLAGAACVLLDLGLPDSQGLNGLRQLLEVEPEAAVVVLTGDTNEHLGELAVRAGAQDYLVKGEVAGHMLHRVIRYAMERRRAEEAQRDLAGGQHMLLGGDFYDVVEVADGWVHALIGDVCGRGPAEAALGVCLRVAWRALVLAGRPADEILFTLSQLLGHERQDDTMFATMCMVSVAPERNVGWVRMAGHLPPLLLTRDGVRELPTLSSPPLGLSDVRDWPGTHVRLEDSWSILLYTDGLIEGRIGRGSERLGSERLMDLIRNIQRQGPFPGNADGHAPTDDQLLDQLIDRVRQLNGKDLDDDLAILALSFSSPDGR